MSEKSFEDNTTQEQSSSPKRSPIDSMIGQKIGTCTIKSILGSGGMGTVYEAVQENPRRRVALKMIKSGITSRSAIRRFEFESQTLARLKHSGVAQIYEAGTHDDGSGGLPYFIMEYIPNAKTLTEYVDDNNLDINDKLKLFIDICNAVQHGHLKGIVHRDLKPGNILVDANGQPKIIDFGVARSTDSDMSVTTLQTDIGQIIGTFQYMSPEQCDADPSDIDVRSDVYALGVILYELLTGNLPYDLHQKVIHEAIRIVREVEPIKLSTINRKLRGDLETIALKALAKNRVKRYQSANDIEEDIKRYINDEPISARPPSLLDYFFRFVRKNTIAASLIFALLTVVVAVATAGGWITARHDRDRAIDISSQLKIEQLKAEELRAQAQQFELDSIKGRVATLVSKDSMLDLLESFVNNSGYDWPENQLSIRSDHTPLLIFGNEQAVQEVVSVPIKGVLGIEAEGYSSDQGELARFDIRPEVLDKLLEDLSYRPRVKVIVFDIASGGGAVAGVTQLNKVVSRYKDRFIFLSYVRHAYSATAALALGSQYTVFHTDGILGGLTAYSGDVTKALSIDESYDLFFSSTQDFIDRDLFSELHDKGQISADDAVDYGIAMGITETVQEAVDLFRDKNDTPLDGRTYKIIDSTRYIEYLKIAYKWTEVGRLDYVINEMIQHLYDLAEGEIEEADCEYLTHQMNLLFDYYDTGPTVFQMDLCNDELKLMIMVGLLSYVTESCDNQNGDKGRVSAADALGLIRLALNNDFRGTGLANHFIDVRNYEMAESYILQLIETLSTTIGESHWITDEYRMELIELYELSGDAVKANEYRLQYKLE